MTHLGRTAIAMLATVLGAGPAWAAGPSLTPVADRPDAVVGGLYAQVVTRHPLGMPIGADQAVFAPYVSKALWRRFEDSAACTIDWARQHPGPDLKPPGEYEDGLFSGSSEHAEPTAFRIERSQSTRAGARVLVRLTRTDPDNAQPTIWYVAALTVREGRRWVVNDILFLKTAHGPIQQRLSAPWRGCRHGRWVGG